MTELNVNDLLAEVNHLRRELEAAEKDKAMLYARVQEFAGQADRCAKELFAALSDAARLRTKLEEKSHD